MISSAQWDAVMRAHDRATDAVAKFVAGGEYELLVAYRRAERMFLDLGHDLMRDDRPTSVSHVDGGDDPEPDQEPDTVTRPMTARNLSRAVQNAGRMVASRMAQETITIRRLQPTDRADYVLQLHVTGGDHEWAENVSPRLGDLLIRQGFAVDERDAES